MFPRPAQTIIAPKEGDDAFLSSLAKRIGAPAQAEALERLFRAASAIRRAQCSTIDGAVACIQEYDQLEKERQVRAAAGNRDYQPLLVPMAGFVATLHAACQLPLQEISRLLPHTQEYVAFHRKNSDWGEKQADVRIRALKAIAKLLNDWA
jgi:hypothetical protein